MQKLAIFFICAAAACSPAEPAAARSVDKLLVDSSLLGNTDEIPAASGRTSMVFRGREKTAGFNLHSYLAHYGGKFWAVWSSAGVREEDPDQFVRYATSQDGHRWSEPGTVVADPDGPGGAGRWIARGIYLDAGKLTVLAAYVEGAAYGQRGKAEVWPNLRLMRFEWDGKRWQDRGLFAGNCMNNFPPQRLGGVLAMVCRDSRMDVSMALSEKPGTWRLTPITNAPPYDKMDEPTFYATSGGQVHLLIRDNNRSGYLLRAISRDNGRTWSAPVRTNYPDATSKNFAGRLSNGWYFLINNPSPKGRDPLAITFSRDGWEFGRPLAIRRGAPGRRFGGPAKSGGSFQYPHAIERGGSLWIVYSTNKEDIEITEIPLATMGLGR